MPIALLEQMLPVVIVGEEASNQPGKDAEDSE